MEEIRKTESGIVIPQGSNDENCVGATVVSVGAKVNNEKETNAKIVAGDVVLFGQYSGTKLNCSSSVSGSYMIVKASDILGIIKK